jgi:hypothetical protein
MTASTSSGAISSRGQVTAYLARTFIAADSARAESASRTAVTQARAVRRKIVSTNRMGLPPSTRTDDVNSIQESGYTVVRTRPSIVNLGSTQTPPSRLDFTAASTKAMPMAPSSTVAHSMGTSQPLPRIFASRAKEASE